MKLFRLGKLILESIINRLYGKHYDHTLFMRQQKYYHKIIEKPKKSTLNQFGIKCFSKRICNIVNLSNVSVHNN